MQAVGVAPVPLSTQKRVGEQGSWRTGHLRAVTATYGAKARAGAQLEYKKGGSSVEGATGTRTVPRTAAGER